MHPPETRLAGTTLALVIILFSASSRAEEFEMNPASTLQEPGAVNQVIDADPVSTKDWPATLVFRTPAGGCTATAVGRRVVLTAAHCVTDGQKGSVTTNGEKATVTCDHHPYYLVDYSADFALCSSDKDLAFTPHENVNTEPATGDAGEQITLLGYGCLKKNGTDKSFGYLYKGLAMASAIPLYR